MKTALNGAFSTLAFVAAISATVPASAQEKVGVVTTVIGPVTVTRASLPPEPLKFKDDVFIRDRVTTGEDAITRILLGGKIVITARERSTVTITEAPGLATIHLAGGRIAVAVEKSLMKPGERVDVRTPHAVAGVRGTVLVVEAQPTTSTVTVLRGLVHVTRLSSSSGLPIGGFTAVAAQQAVTVRNNVLPSRPQAITPARASELTQEFAPPLKSVTPVAVAPSDDQARSLATLNTAPPGVDGDKSRPSAAASGASPTSAPAASTSASTPASGSTPAATGTPAATASAVATAPAAATAPATVAPPAASAAPVVVAPPAAPSAPVVVAPSAAASVPVVALPPAAATAAALVLPTPAVVTAPAPPPATSTKINVSNLGSSWKELGSKRGKDGDSGNSGKR